MYTAGGWGGGGRGYFFKRAKFFKIGPPNHTEFLDNPPS